MFKIIDIILLKFILVAEKNVKLINSNLDLINKKEM